MRDCTHSIDETQGEEFEKVQLEGGWTPALTEIKDCEVLVIVVLKQIRDYAKEIEQVDLEEALVDVLAESFGLSFEQERDYLSGGNGDGLAARFGKSYVVVKELLDCALDGFLDIYIDLRSQWLPGELSDFFESNQHQSRNEVNWFIS